MLGGVVWLPLGLQVFTFANPPIYAISLIFSVFFAEKLLAPPLFLSDNPPSFLLPQDFVAVKALVLSVAAGGTGSFDNVLMGVWLCQIWLTLRRY